jgi:hypothetical protein
MVVLRRSRGSQKYLVRRIVTTFVADRQKYRAGVGAVSSLRSWHLVAPFVQEATDCTDCTDWKGLARMNRGGDRRSDSSVFEKVAIPIHFHPCLSLEICVIRGEEVFTPTPVADVSTSPLWNAVSLASGRRLCHNSPVELTSKQSGRAAASWATRVSF